MELSCKCEYVLLALLELGVNYAAGQPVQMRQIAQKQSIPHRYLEQLLGILRSSGLVHSHRGVKGGYSLSRDPRSITVLDVIRCVEGFSVTETPHKSPPKNLECSVIQDIWDEARKAAGSILDSYTLQDLVDKRNERQSHNLMYYI